VIPKKGTKVTKLSQIAIFCTSRQSVRIDQASVMGIPSKLIPSPSKL